MSAMAQTSMLHNPITPRGYRLSLVGMTIPIILFEFGCSTRPTGAPISVTADEISAEYFANSARADLKYKGKLVEVTGIVDSAKEDATLRAQDVFIYTSMASTAEATKLNKGQHVKLECVGRGDVSGFAKLGDCIVK